MAAKSDADAQGDQPAEGQPREDQPAGEGQKQEIRLRIDERNLNTSYANAFRTDATADEVMLYFGLNLINNGPGKQEDSPRSRARRSSSSRSTSASS